MQILRRILNTYEMENVSVVADDVVNQRGSYQTLKNISLMIVTWNIAGTITFYSGGKIYCLGLI